MQNSLSWFPLNIANFYKNTRQLSLLEQGAYINLIIAYIENNGVIRNDNTLYRLCMAVTEVEITAVITVVTKFFRKDGDYLISDELNQLISRQKSFVQQKSLAGKKSAEKRWGKSNVCSNNINIKEREEIKEKENIKEKEKNITPAQQADTLGRKPREYPEIFETFWKAYPNRHEKPKALEEWNKAMKKTSAEVIMQSLEKYRKSRQVEQGFAPYPAKWLKQECWGEDFEPYQAKQKEQPKREIGYV